MLGSPSLRRPGGLMTPRGPGVLAILLVLTLGAIFYWGGARDPDLSVPQMAPPERAHEDAATPAASPVLPSDAGE
jgi:hypothetical protein